VLDDRARGGTVQNGWQGYGRVNALFLTDGGLEQGFGHLTRCLAMAEGLARVERSIEIDVVVHGDRNAIEFLRTAPVTARLLDWHRQIEVVLTHISATSVVVVDSYLAPQSVYEILASRVQPGRFVVIDDDNRMPYPPGIIVRPSVCGVVPEPTPPNIVYLAGAEYVLLREPFWEDPVSPLSESIATVLVTLGGSQVARDCQDDLATWIAVDFGVHPTVLDPHERILDAGAMRRFMLAADVCITGGGITSEELARLGVPAIGISFSDDQDLNLASMASAGSILYIGSCHAPDLRERLRQALVRLRSLAERRSLSQAGRRIIDGQGALRVAKAVVGNEH